MNRRQFAMRSLAAAAGAILHRSLGYAAAPQVSGSVPESLIQRARAFHAWTLLDHLQWGEGYTERYGLIYNDFRNRKRTIKDSGYWYVRVSAANRLYG